MTPVKGKSRPRTTSARATRTGYFPWGWVTLGVLAAVVVAATWLATPTITPLGDETRAVVIDQLSPEYANETLRAAARDSLESFGLEVSEYEGEEVDVDLYRNLGLLNCSVCLIRSHSGVLVLEAEEEEYVTSLFTNEPYSELKYVHEQLQDRVLIVRPYEEDPQLSFGISPSFVSESMKGEFPSTIVIIAGCSCLGRLDLAEAFLSRGASVVVSWNRPVYLDHLDVATAHFLDGFFSQELTLENAVIETMAEYGSDPEFGAILTYLPETAGRFTARELIG